MRAGAGYCNPMGFNAGISLRNRPLNQPFIPGFRWFYIMRLNLNINLTQSVGMLNRVHINQDRHMKKTSRIKIPDGSRKEYRENNGIRPARKAGMHGAENRVENKYIQFKDVSYDLDGKKTVKNVSFSLGMKSLTMIVGRENSGAWSLSRLLAGISDPDEGEINIAGEEIRNYHLDQIINTVGVVFRESPILNESILNNIRIGNECATFSRIVNAATLARCNPFIQKLPGDYRTIIGEGGVELSRGEIYRISLARSILSASPVLVLDWPGSEIDAESRKMIYEVITTLKKTRTIVLISPHPDIQFQPDNILVMHEGHLVEQGSHDSLLSIHGLYRRLWFERSETETEESLIS